MSPQNRDCDGEFERPGRTLVLSIFALAVIMKLCIIMVEILDFGNYLEGNGQKERN